MTTHTISLIVDIFLLIVCILQIFANLLVLIVWVTNRKLRQNNNLILLVSLAFIDFVYAVLQFPYLVILIMGWQPDGIPFNYDPYLIVQLVGPSAALMKSGCTVTTAIAIDRIIAFYYPVKYYQLSKRKWCTGAFIFSLLMALIDWIILQLLVTIQPKPECANFGCFTNETFRAYWGLSNMFVNFLSCILTVIIIDHLFRRQPTDIREAVEKQNRAKIDKNANRVAIYILLVSALIGVVPGCLNGVGTIVHIQIVNEISFFVGTSATLSGLSHAFIFAMAHKDIQKTISQLFKCSSGKVSQKPSSTFTQGNQQAAAPSTSA